VNGGEPSSDSSVQKVVSVSLGSSSRNHTTRQVFLGQEFEISREGYDGDFNAVKKRFRELNGKASLGIGGQDRYLRVKNRCYEFMHARQLVRLAPDSHVVDGSGLKNTLERKCIRYLIDQGTIPIEGRRVFLTSGLDRFGMAESMVEAGCKVVFGDLVVALNINIPIHSLDRLAWWARVLMPAVVHFPNSWLYPTGENQQQKSGKNFHYHYEEADIVAGDFHYIRRYAPEKMSGKTVITNTVTPSDVDLLTRAGVKWLVTTTPDFDGRSFGTNVLEAVFVTLLGKSDGEVSDSEYYDLIDKLDLKPRIEELN
jgi:hypothetical protein